MPHPAPVTLYLLPNGSDYAPLSPPQYMHWTPYGNARMLLAGGVLYLSVMGGGDLTACDRDRGAALGYEFLLGLSHPHGGPLDP